MTSIVARASTRRHISFGSHRVKAIFRTVRHSSPSTRRAASRPPPRINNTIVVTTKPRRRSTTLLQATHRVLDLFHRRSSVLSEQTLLSSAPDVFTSARHRHRDWIFIHPVRHHVRVRSHLKNRRFRGFEFLHPPVCARCVRDDARARQSFSRLARGALARRRARRPAPSHPHALARRARE